MGREDWGHMFRDEAAALRYLMSLKGESRQSAAFALGLSDELAHALIAAPLPLVAGAEVKPRSVRPKKPRKAEIVPFRASTTHTGPLTLELPWPPSLNSIWRSMVMQTSTGPQVRVYLSERGKAYRKAVMNAIDAAGNPAMPIGARLALHLNACQPDRRARDLSNLPKALEDALTHAGVWGDDSLIDDLRVIRGPIRRDGLVITTITPLETPQPLLGWED